MKKILLVFLSCLLFILTSCDKTEVSEEEWKAAFSLEAFSNVTVVVISGEPGMADCEKRTVKFDNGKYFDLEEEIYTDGGSFEEDEMSYYFTDSDGASWEYYKNNNGEW